MSRAFVREAEPGEPRCPGCGALGVAVGLPTLEARLPAEARALLGAAAFYCEAAACGVAYFNAWGTRVPAPPTAWPKDPEGLVCPCFGVKAAEVEADARDGRKDRVKALLERARSPEARCVERRPDGLSCIPQVMRLFREGFGPG